MSNLRVVLTDSDFPDIHLETSVLSTLNIELQRFACRTPDDVVAAAQNADALIVQWASVTRAAIEQLPRLRAIARFGIGVDMIDVNAATDLGVAVCNTPEYCIDEVASHAISLILALVRRLHAAPAALGAHRWGFKAVDGTIKALSSQTLGIVGFGRIGRRTASYARSLGFDVIAFDPYLSDSSLPLVSFEELLRRSDVISIHSPLTPATQDLFNAAAFPLMKRSAYLVNTSRGKIVEPRSLEEALRSGMIAGAALDVLPVEPPDWSDSLLTAPNLMITPHISWYSEGSPERMRQEAAAALVKLFQGERPAGLLNPDALKSLRWIGTHSAKTNA